MAKPSGGFFGDFFGKIGDLLQSISDIFSAVQANVELVLNLKATAQKDFDDLLTQLKELTASQQDFANRAKTLKKRLIRADVVFEFIDEIRTGELKQFCVDQFGSLHTTLIGTIDQITSTPLAGAAFTSKGIFIINWIRKIALIWATIGVVIDTLKGIVPVVQAFKDKLEKFEDVILPQSNSRFRLKKTISARRGKLHASA